MKKQVEAVKKAVKAKIISNNSVAADHFVLHLDTPYIRTNAVPGQFVNVKVQDNTTDPLLRIPLGIHAFRKRGILLLYKVVGAGTEKLSLRRRGETVDVLGPLGRGFDLSPLRGRGIKAVLVAGGQGIAPLYALAEEISKRKGEVNFFIGARTKKHVVCLKEIRKLGAKVYVATEDGTQGYKGCVTDMFRDCFSRKGSRLRSGQGSQRAQVAVYACGPGPMLAVLAAAAREFKVPAQVSLDAYMACGFGACLGCAIETVEGYKLVCKDGPVFDAREIRWQKYAE